MEEHTLAVEHHWSGSVIVCQTCDMMLQLEDEYGDGPIPITIDVLEWFTAQHMEEISDPPLSESGA